MKSIHQQLKTLNTGNLYVNYDFPVTGCNIEVRIFTNIPREDRLYNRCNSNSTDDETHFMNTCEKYDHQ